MTVEFRADSLTHLTDVNDAGINDATAVGVALTGTPGSSGDPLTVDAVTAPCAIGAMFTTGVAGECDVNEVGTATFVVMKLTDGVSLGYYDRP